MDEGVEAMTNRIIYIGVVGGHRAWERFLAALTPSAVMVSRVRGYIDTKDVKFLYISQPQDCQGVVLHEVVSIGEEDPRVLEEARTRVRPPEYFR